MIAPASTITTIITILTTTSTIPKQPEFFNWWVRVTSPSAWGHIARSRPLRITPRPLYGELGGKKGLRRDGRRRGSAAYGKHRMWDSSRNVTCATITVIIVYLSNCNFLDRYFLIYGSLVGWDIDFRNDETLPPPSPRL